MRENLNNIQFTCPEHSSKPDPELAKLPPADFVGKFVKLGFKGKRPDGTETLEHMWVEVKGIEGGELIGELNNDPLLEMEYSCGDRVAFTTDEIEEVFKET